MKSKQRLKEEKRFGLIQFIWFGFSLTAGVKFYNLFAVWSTPGSPDNPIGMHALWVLMLTGLLAMGCSYAYTKLSRICHSNYNGAGYIYARSAYGRMIGGFVGFMQYVAIPLIIMIQILFLFRGIFATGYSNGPQVWNSWTDHLGPFKNLYLDLAGILIYMGAALVALLGIRYFRWFVNFNSIAAWIISVALLSSYLAVAIRARNDGFKYWTTDVGAGGGNQLSFKGILNVAVAAFFSYSGFESYTSAGRNLKDPERNIGRGVTTTMLLVIVFYVLGGLMCFAGFYGGKDSNTSFNQLMHFTVWGRFGSAGIKIFGIVIIMAHNFLYKFQISNENMFYGGTMIQPLADEGYIPEKFKKLDEPRGNIPRRAMILNYVISIIVVVLFLILPDVIDGVLNQSKGSLKASDVWNLSSLAEIQSVVVILLYFIVITVVFKFKFERKLTLKHWESFIFGITSGFLLILFGSHYYHLFDRIIRPGQSKPHDNLLLQIAAGAELVFAFLVYSGILLVLVFYYRPKLKSRLKHQPEVQKRLDSEFRLHDDWYYVCAKFNQELQTYLQRNQAKFPDKQPNDNYSQASSMKKEVAQVVADYESFLRS